MELLEKRLYYIDLLHLYGELLSVTQKDILTDNLEFDLSLSEIASNREISRAAVEDAIKKGIKKLDEYENKLNLFQKNSTIRDKVTFLKEKLGDLEELNNIEEVIK